MNTGTQYQTDENQTLTRPGGQSSAQISSNQQSSVGQSEQENNRSLTEDNYAPDYAALKYRRPQDVLATKAATGLGWFSIALGLAEILAPKKLGAAIGVGEEHTTLLPALGMREIASGIGIFMEPRPAASLWSRVGGDAMDLALMGAALVSGKNNKGRILMAVAAVAGVAALDYICAQQLSENVSDRDGNPMAPSTAGQPSGRRASSVL